MQTCCCQIVMYFIQQDKLWVTSWTGTSVSALKKPWHFLDAGCCSFVMFDSGTGATCRSFVIMAAFRIRLLAPLQFEAWIQDGSFMKFSMTEFSEQSPSGPTHTWSPAWCTRPPTEPWGSRDRSPPYYWPPLMHTVSGSLISCQDVNQVSQNILLIQSKLVFCIAREYILPSGVLNWEFQCVALLAWRHLILEQLTAWMDLHSWDTMAAAVTNTLTSVNQWYVLEC